MIKFRKPTIIKTAQFLILIIGGLSSTKNYAADFATVANRGVLTSGNEFVWNATVTWTKTGSGGITYPSLSTENVTITDFTYRLLAILPLTTSGSNVSLQNGNSITVNNCSISGESQLTIPSGASLTVNNMTLSNTAILTISGGGTLIVNGVLTIGTTSRLNLDGNLAINSVSGSSTQIYGSSTGILTINGSGSLLSLALNSTASKLGGLILNRINGTSPSFQFTTSTTLENILTINNGAYFSVAANTITLNSNSSVVNIQDFSQTVLDIGGNGILILNGSIVNPQRMRGSNTSTLTINGTGLLSNLKLDPSYNYLSKLIINKTNSNATSVTLANTIQIQDEVTLGTNAILNAGDQLLVFKGSTTKTARLAALSGTSDIIGNVVVEKYIAGGAAQKTYKLLAFPVRTESDGGFKLSAIASQLYITGSGGVTNGFDASRVNGASAYLYNEQLNISSARRYTAITNINTAVPSATGLYLYYYGPKTQSAVNPSNSNASSIAPDNMMLSIKGGINKGSITKTVTKTGANSYDGWALIGNPYISAINFASVTRTNVSNGVYYYIPATKSYALYNGADPANSTMGATAIIPSGESFFVKTTSATGQLIFTEACKVSSTQFKTYSVSQQSVNTSKRIKIQLSYDQTIYDETIISSHEDNNNAVDDNDFQRFDDGIASISSVVNDVPLLINYMNTINDNTTIPIKITSTLTGDFTLNFSNITNFENQVIELEDKYLHQFISILPGSIYSFNIQKNEIATFSDRFVLHFNPLTTLPLKWLSFDAKLKAGKVNCTWEISELNAISFELEKKDRLTNDFIKIGRCNALKAGEMQFSLNDDHPFYGENYYRVKAINSDGTYSYSVIKAVNYEFKESISFYPNPVVDYINLKLYPESFNFKLNVFNFEGKLVLTSKVSSIENSVLLTFLPRGSYIIKLFNSSDVVVLTDKFIKSL